MGDDANGTPSDRDGPKPLPLSLGLPPPVTPAVVGVATRARPATRTEARPVAWAALGVVALVLAAIGGLAFVFLLPWYVRTQCIEQAASHGITLTVGEVAVGPSSFSLTNVAMVARDLPDARLTSSEVDVDTSWLQPTKVSAKGMELDLKGHFSDVAASVEKWAASDHGFRGSGWAANVFQQTAIRAANKLEFARWTSFWIRTTPTSALIPTSRQLRLCRRRDHWAS